MRKNLNHTVSVIKNTKKVISSSEADWSTIKEGSYFKLNKDSIFYTIVNSKPIYFIKDFEVIDQSNIKINSNIGPNLILGDTLIISYKEYTLTTLLGIPNGGAGYKINDIVTVNGGKVSTDIKTGLTEYTSFIVNEVDGNGSILSLGPNTKGKYLEKPTEIVGVVDGSGTGAVLEVSYGLIDDRANIERVVQSIKLNDSYTEIFLDAPLPKGLSLGKLSVDKWEITLSSEYMGESAQNEYYQICQNFTPYYRIPLAGKGSLAMDVLYNQSVIKIDDLIGTLEDEITALKEEIKLLKNKIN